MCFVLFGWNWDVWLPYKTRCKTAEVVQKFVPLSRVRIFCNECTHPPHWTQNSCSIVFYTIFVHLAPFGFVTKLNAKRAKLMQKFVPRSRVGIFRNERNQSTPLYPKVMFCDVSYYLCAFRTVWLPYETRCKTDRTSAKSSCPDVALEFFATNTPDPPHCTLNWCFGAFRIICVHSGMFGCLTKLVAKRTELVQKVRAPMSHWNFSQWTIHHIGPRTDVLVRFVLFGCIRDRLVALRNSMQNGPN